VTRVVEVWGPPWRRLLGNCAAIAAGTGAPLCIVLLPAADDLVAGLKARGVAVRCRQARQSVVDAAELRAISQGWPVRYRWPGERPRRPLVGNFSGLYSQMFPISAVSLRRCG
jgi:hypothetical protein